MTDDHDLDGAFKQIVAEARRVSADVGATVNEILRVGKSKPLTETESKRLLTKVLTVLRAKARSRGDERAKASLAGDVDALVRRVVEVRERLDGDGTSGGTSEELGKSHVDLLEEHGGVKPHIVKPRPCFHGVEVPMRAGFVRVRRLQLWGENERLDIHLNQFRNEHKREPTSEELLDIMQGKLRLKGVPSDVAEDQFEIQKLARSIAANGVRQPPILDTDGTLLDGNRRVAACKFILDCDDSEEVSTEAKERAEWVYAYQLTEVANNDDRVEVVIALNFEDDCKKDWPEYVKARKVHDQWHKMLALEKRPPGTSRLLELKKELARKFALSVDEVTRYLKMVDWVTLFEEYQVQEAKQDEHEVRHVANRYFQYFDELSKGEKTGVASTLRRDDGYRKLVFDLLFQGKFRNWRQIRDLKDVFHDEDALKKLREAREADKKDEAEELIDDAIGFARTSVAERRTSNAVRADTKIAEFVNWLTKLPVKSFKADMKPETLQSLLSALRLVEKHVEGILSEDEAGDAD